MSVSTSVSTNVKTSYFKGNRLVFKPTGTDTATLNQKALEKGVRIANFAQRFFGKSTAVNINGKSIHLNTNSLNKYHATLLSDKSGTKFTNRVQARVFKKLEKSIFSPMKKAGKPLTQKAITTLLSTAKASASDYGTALCDLHNNQTAPSPELAQAVRVVADGDAVSLGSLNSDAVSRTSGDRVAVDALQEAQTRVEAARKNLTRAEARRGQEDLNEAIEYLKTEGLKQTQEAISFLLENREVITKKIEQLILDSCAKKDLPPGLVDQLLVESKGLVFKVVAELRDAFKRTEDVIQKMRDHHSRSSENSDSHHFVDSICLLLEGVTQTLEALEPLIGSFHSASETAKVLFEQLKFACNIYKPAPTRKVQLPNGVKRRITKTAVATVFNRRKVLFEKAKKALLSEQESKKSSALFSWIKRVVQSVVLEHPDVAKSELKRLILKEFKKTREQRGALDPDLVAAKNEFKAATKALEKIKKESVRIKVARSLSGVRRSISVSQIDRRFMQSLVADPFSLPALDDFEDEFTDSAPSSPDRLSLDSFDSGVASVDNVSIGSENLDSISRQSVESGYVDDDGDEFFDYVDDDGDEFFDVVESFTPYVDPFGLDGNEPSIVDTLELD